MKIKSKLRIAKKTANKVDLKNLVEGKNCKIKLMKFLKKIKMKTLIIINRKK